MCFSGQEEECKQDDWKSSNWVANQGWPRTEDAMFVKGKKEHMYVQHKLNHVEDIFTLLVIRRLNIYLCMEFWTPKESV